MKIIKPTKITDAILVSSTVAETDYTAWSSGTAYVTGNRCILNHKIYECITGNTGVNPATDVTSTVPKWLEVSATNRWKAFDGKVLDQTSAATSINYVIAPGTVDSISLLNMDAVSVAIVMTDPTDGTVYNKSYDLTTTSNVIDFYTYCFAPIIRKTDLAVMDLPPYPSASLSVTVTLTGGTAKVGEIVVGQQSYLGGTEYGASASIIDYSRKDTDTFGNFIIVQRKFSRKITCNLFIDNGFVDEVYRLLSLYRTTPLVWIAAEDLSMMIAYGFYKSFEITIPYPNNSACSLEIEGLT